MNLYIGNLAPNATETDLQQAFAAFGQITSTVITKDKASGESRGFGFVEMPNATEAAAAMAGLAGTDLAGQSLIVSEAHARGTERRAAGPHSS